MKAIMLAVAVIVVVIGTFAFVVYWDPNRTQVQDALGILHETSGVPLDPGALGYLNLRKRHLDGLEGAADFKDSYSAELAMQRMNQLEGFLDSFRNLTSLGRVRFSPAELAAVGNTDSEMQTIGFHNIPLVVEGTILKQDYLLRQTEYKLAQLKRIGGDLTEAELEQKKLAYAIATRKLQQFWDTRLPTD